MSKTAFVVLGMHRSGTSSIAGVLSRIGAAAPQTQIPPGTDNPRGFFESRVIVGLNDTLLAATGSSWTDWREFDGSAAGEETLEQFHDAIGVAMQGEFGAANAIVLKDPRICRLFPLWQQGLADAGYDTRVILPIRSPLEVAMSLQSRNGTAIADGLLLWLRHVLDAERASRGRPRLVIAWEDFMGDWQKAVRRFSDELGGDFRLSGEQVADVDAYLSHDLRHEVSSHQALSEGPDAHAWVRDTYDCLCELVASADNVSVRRRLDRLRSEFNAASAIFGRAVEPAKRRAQDADGLEVDRNAWRDLHGAATNLVGRMDQNLERAGEQYLQLKSQALSHVEVLSAQLKASNAEAQSSRLRLEKADHDLATRERELGALATELVDTRTRLEATQGQVNSAHVSLSIASAMTEKMMAESTDWERRTSALTGELDATRRDHLDFVQRLAHQPVKTAWRTWWPVQRKGIARQTLNIRRMVHRSPTNSSEPAA